jgi:hypothetical protein
MWYNNPLDGGGGDICNRDSRNIIKSIVGGNGGA